MSRLDAGEATTGSEPVATAASAARAAGRPRLDLRDLPRSLGVSQVLRLALCGARIGARHLAGWLGDRITPAASREARATRRRERATADLVATLGALKGPFAKAGQFAAIRHALLPGDVTEARSALRDRVPPLPFSRVHRTVEAELGAPLEQLFRDFESTPLGAASVAQVHRARLHSGDEVAVKVQYPWLASSLAADLAILRALAALLLRGDAAASVDRARLADEFAAGLAEELDFVREADVATEIAANLAGDASVVVPEPVRSHCSRRVLTMGYHAAIPILDLARLDERGVDRRAVLQSLARAYAKQVFVDGLFHADPHPGNLFVLDEENTGTRPRLLFVDFGLSRRLDPTLRREMRKGIYAMLQRDPDAFVAGMDRMGMIAPGAHERVKAACTSMLTRVGAEGGLAAGGGAVLGLKDEAKALLQDTPGLQLPNDLLLYAKTMTYVFGLGAEIAPEVDLMQLSLPYLLQFLAEKDAS